LRDGKVQSPGGKRYDREILYLALPALGALAAEPTYVLVDTAIVEPETKRSRSPVEARFILSR